jgi:hypothetical protein
LAVCGERERVRDDGGDRSARPFCFAGAAGLRPLAAATSLYLPSPPLPPVCAPPPISLIPFAPACRFRARRFHVRNWPCAPGACNRPGAKAATTRVAGVTSRRRGAPPSRRSPRDCRQLMVRHEVSAASLHELVPRTRSVGTVGRQVEVEGLCRETMCVPTLHRRPHPRLNDLAHRLARPRRRVGGAGSASPMRACALKKINRI